MAEKGQVHPISRKTLESHLSKVDEHMRSINRGSSTERDNLYTLMKGIGTNNTDLLDEDVDKTVKALRQGFALFYEMHGLLEKSAEGVNGAVPEREKRTFLNSYAMFSATSYIENQLSLIMGDASPIPVDDKDSIKLNMDLSKDDLLNVALARYYGLVNIGKRNTIFDKGIDVPRSSYELFQHYRALSLEGKEKFNPKLVDLVSGAQFRIADEFTITGFEAGFAEKEKKAKVEFVPVLPHEVAGNVLAKQEMLRDMDRIALFDLGAKRNPILEVGGLSWSVLYDGLPGTGKDTLFKMGLTRLRARVEQASEYWKHKNMGELNWTKIDIDQGVKDEFYGKTGKNLLEKLEPTKRADGIYIALLNDIDLLVSGDRNSSSGGGDRDIMNILMQYADSVNTIIRGNVQLWGATNDATAMDPALRQRFLARYSVDGPQEWYDFADIMYNKLRTWVDSGIVATKPGKGYDPFKMRLDKNGEIIRSDSEQGGLDKSFGTLRDLGELMAEHKKKNERFTGRAVHAVSEAIKKRINNYEIPEEWYSKPEIFFAQEYAAKAQLLRELCVKVDANVIAEEIERYAKSESRYANDKFESDVSRLVHGARVQDEARKRLLDTGGKHA